MNKITVVAILINQLDKLKVELDGLDNNTNAFQCDKDMTYGAICGINRCLELIKGEV